MKLVIGAASMKATSKIALITASILSMTALTACQSTNTPKHDHDARMMGHHQHGHQMTPEQRAQMKQMREERKAVHAQIQKACDGKALGQAVQIKAGEKTLDGSCNMVFKIDRKAMNEMRDARHDQGRMMHGHHRGERHMQQMTEEQRAQLQQQREQKRAERQAQWETMQKACVGQNNGQAIQVKLGDKTVNGTCVVKFQAQKQTQPMQPLVPTNDLKVS